MQLKAGAINVEHAQLNKLFKCMATNSLVCPFRGGPAIEPPSNVPELAAKEDRSAERQGGCQEMFTFPLPL